MKMRRSWWPAQPVRLSLPIHSSSRSSSARGHVKGVVVKADGGRQVWGDPRITVATEPGTEILVDADVFTQINPEGNRALLQHLLSAGEFSIQDRILELYCGAGNFTLPMARRSAEVVAVESDRHAIDNGKLNAATSWH